MKNLYLALFAILTALSSMGQSNFDMGYYVDNNGNKIVCLIKNQAWKNNPSSFVYRLPDDVVELTASIDEVKEFGVGQEFKFVRESVKIDRSDNQIKNLDFNKDPVWSEEEVFLKVLIEGNASLYVFRDGNIIRFFYRVNDSQIEQLIYRKYLAHSSDNQSMVTGNSGVRENNFFRQQLWLDVRCPSFELNDLKSIQYNQKSLAKYFRNFYNCVDEDYVDFEAATQTGQVHLKFTPGVNLNTFSIRSSTGIRDIDFDLSYSIRLGVEFEYVLPFNNSKWAIVIEPTLQSFGQKKETETNGVLFDHSFVEFPLGLRYYMFLNDDFKLFVNGFIISSFVIDIENFVYYTKPQGLLDVEHRSSAAFGTGVSYKRISSEVRYYTNRNLLPYLNMKTYYQRYALVVGFSVF